MLSSAGDSRGRMLCVTAGATSWDRRKGLRGIRGRGSVSRQVIPVEVPFTITKVYVTCPVYDFQISLFLTDNLWWNTWKHTASVPKQRVNHIQPMEVSHLPNTQDTVMLFKGYRCLLFAAVLGISAVSDKGCSVQSHWLFWKLCYCLNCITAPLSAVHFPATHEDTASPLQCMVLACFTGSPMSLIF